MNGPNRPLRTSTGLPHTGQRSSCRFERSCTSWMICWTSTAASALEKGPQKSPNTCCQPRSPSSTLSSSVSICRSEEHTSELQSLAYLVCRLLLEKKKQKLFVCKYFCDLTT